MAQSDIQSLGTLPNEVFETSGLIVYNGQLITHNDSGNAPALYELDIETLEIVRTVTVLNAENIDWEDLTQDSNFIYIGDIGNNQGDRQDLGVLRISKQAFDNSNEVTAERISFLYEDQTDFTTTVDSDFDAEALFSLGNDLIVLTKQWQSGGTVAYKIPKTPGAFLAERLDSFQVNGLVTGASFDAFSNTLYLVGYSQLLIPFFVEVPDVNSIAIFSGEVIKTVFDIGPTQMEALTFSGDTFYASSENFDMPPLLSSSRLFTFTLDAVDTPDPPINPPEITEELIVYRNADSTLLNYELNSDRPIFGMGIFDMQGRMLVFTPLEAITEAPIDISPLSQGLYYLAFFYDNQVISTAFFRN